MFITILIYQFKFTKTIKTQIIIFVDTSFFNVNRFTCSIVFPIFNPKSFYVVFKLVSADLIFEHNCLIA